MTYDRAALMSYFSARHSQREMLSLTSFRFNGLSNGYANFEYVLWRRARDLDRNRPRRYNGKGAAFCGEPSLLAVWSMGSTR